MNEIKELRKKLGITQKEVADHLNVTSKTYTLWEKTTIKRKEEILRFFLKYEFKDKFLGLGVARLSKALNMNKGNLSIYMRSGKEIKGLDKVLADRRSEIMDLKIECTRLLDECLKKTII